MSSAPPIYVTKPSLPPLAELQPYLEEIWESGVLTNNGPFHGRFEEALARHLGVERVALVANGTIGLIVALQALGIEGEVITTPYSFAATAHSLVWNRLQPVFADIDPETFNIDPERIEAAVTPRTSAILAVHCYGTPCDVDAIERVAAAHGLRVVYDAAHAFGVRDRGESVLRRGELSVLSFHATKVFNTFEGGAIVCPDAATKQRIDFLKNFGIADEVTVVMPGINGKMNEFQAALGLLQLRYVDAAIERRRRVFETYAQALRGVPGIESRAPQPGTAPNYSYFPILVGPEFPLSRDGLYDRLRAHGVHPRRYFYPLLAQLPMYRGLASADPSNLPVATRVAGQVLCLPIFGELAQEDVLRIAEIVRSA